MSAVIAKLFSAGLLLAGLLAGCASHPTASLRSVGISQPGTQTRQAFTAQPAPGLPVGYLLYLPKNYASEPTAQFPLILFLHGSGERGTNLQKVAVHGPPKLAGAGRDFPCIVVSPQCPDGKVWNDVPLLDLIDHLKKSLRVDPARIHVTGLSMGGYATWSLISQRPDIFASAAPVCGGGETLRFIVASPAQREAMKTLPVRVYHGAKDNVVALGESERMIEQFKRAGGKDIQLTVYPEAGHDSWSATYSNPDFFSWMLQQHR